MAHSTYFFVSIQQLTAKWPKLGIGFSEFTYPRGKIDSNTSNAISIRGTSTAYFSNVMASRLHEAGAYYLNDDKLSALQQNSETQVSDAFDEEAFKKAFDAANSELQGYETSIQQMDVGERPQLPESSNMPEDMIEYRIGSDRILQESQQRQKSWSNEQEADELARTAGQLLENVKHEQSAKFQGSNFLSLMRQLRDKDVRIEGDNFVDVSTFRMPDLILFTLSGRHVTVLRGRIDRSHR
ncbi:MAG: hypothetical protein Q9201_005160 [Fulgogasparrea decipioides]